MKKLLIAVLSVLFYTPCIFANNWGLGLKAGAGENDPKELKDLSGPYTYSSLDESASVVGLEAFYEWNLKNEKDFVGVKLGYEAFGDNEYSSEKKIFTSPTTEEEWDYEAKEETYAFPLTVYYKRDNGVKKLSYFAGVGATFIRSEGSWSDTYEKEVNDIETDKSYAGASTSKSKVFPHIVAGAEYRFSELFALGLEAKYNINAKIKKNGEVLSDRSGFSGALTARFYF